jgi:hypothetical protein
MITWIGSRIGVALLVALIAQPSQTAPACPRCGWRPPVPRRVVNVKTTDQLERAVATARPGDTILLEDGRYPLRHTVEIGVPDITVRGRSGDPEKVVLHGQGMTEGDVGVAIGVGARGVTIADITIRDVGFHAIQVRGERGASEFTLHNARLQDTGQQLLKGTVAGGGRVFADNGIVACSRFSYTTSAPTNYTDGIDLLATKGWLIRDNQFMRIRGPETGGWSGGPAILVWQASLDTIVERNIIVDSFRGIALGLETSPNVYARDGERSYDHRGGIVRNNVVVNLNPWADEAIEANAARDVRIEHNTVLVEGSAPWSIGVRFPSASANIRNNLTNRGILERNGGHVTQEGNVVTAVRNWFVDAPHADLHLTALASPAIDAGVPIPDINGDFDREPRVAGRAPDAGAFESKPRTSGGQR